MLAPNHVIGGIALTGVTAALCGENIFQTKVNLFCVVFFALLPDIDNPRAPISWICKPLSKHLFRRYGHRTITHSLAALFVVVFVVFGLSYIVTVSTLICGIAYFSHLFLDMMTLQGVPLMYPNRDPWYLPDNPRFRFKTGGSSEVMLFGVFSFLTIFSFPLMQNGFWTTYNRSFGTPKTLHSEFVKSTDILEVVYKIQKGSEIDTGRGLLIDVENETKFTLFRNDSIFHFDATKQIIKSVIPTHTQRKFYIEDKTFVGIEDDSLNNLLRGKIIINIQADANEPFIFMSSGVPQKSLSAKLQFPNRLSFRSLDSLPQKDELFAETDFASMSIRNDLKKLDDEFKFKQNEYQRHVDSIQIYSNLALKESNSMLKEKYQKRRDALRLEEKPQFDEVNRNAYNAALRISEARFIVENQRRIFDREKAYTALIRTKQKTQFVGFVKTIRIE